MPTVSVKNICPGTRGIFREGDLGITDIDPGQTVTLDLSAADLADAEATGWFDIQTTAPARAGKSSKDAG